MLHGNLMTFRYLATSQPGRFATTFDDLLLDFLHLSTFRYQDVYLAVRFFFMITVNKGVYWSVIPLRA